MAREDLFNNYSDAIKTALEKVTDERTLEYVLKTIITGVVIDKCWIYEYCESPIEQMMAAALIEVLKVEELYISPQEVVEIGQKKYRVDFMIKTFPYDHRGDICVAVECDGHDFHEKTKEQAIRDKSRDRAIQSKGIPVLRFTGSEIWNDPRKCAREVRDLILDITNRNR